MRAIIVGGGIGGLATALALSRRGWHVEVLERAAEFTEVGAGLAVWPNGLRAVDALGVGEQVRSRARLEGQAGIRDAAGRWLSRTDTAELERRYGPTAMVHRADLLGILRAAVPDEALRAGVTVTSVRADGTVVHTGGQAHADLVVGADGVRSITRTSIWRDAALRGMPATPPGGWSHRRSRSATAANHGGRENGSATRLWQTAGSTAMPPPTPRPARQTAGWPS